MMVAHKVTLCWLWVTSVQPLDPVYSGIEALYISESDLWRIAGRACDGMVLVDENAVVTRYIEQLFKADPLGRMLNIFGPTVFEADPPISC